MAYRWQRAHARGAHARGELEDVVLNAKSLTLLITPTGESLAKGTDRWKCR